MANEKLEIDKVIPYNNDLSHLPEDFAELLRHSYDTSRVRITYKGSDYESEESAKSFIRQSLNLAIMEKNDSMLMKAVEFGIGELLSEPELRRNYLSYLKREHIKAGKRPSQETQEKKLKYYRDVKKYLEKGFTLAGDNGEKTAFGMAAEENCTTTSSVSDYYYEIEAKLEYEEKTKGTSLGGAGVFLSSEGHDEKVRYLVEQLLKKKKPPSFDEAIRRTSLSLRISEQECLMRYRRARKK